jgi:hypothetical protein
VFLKLAQDSPGHQRQDEVTSRLERRTVRPNFDATSRPSSNREQSRGRRQIQRSSMPASTERSKMTRRDSTGQDSGYATRDTLQSADGQLGGQRRSSGVASSVFSTLSSRPPATISSEQRFNAYRSKYMASSPQSPSVTSRTPDSTQYGGQRRPSAPDALQHILRPQNYRPSRLQQTSVRDVDSVSQVDSSSGYRRSSLRADYRVDAESVVSTAAPLAMWDELNELKSRIQKIEYGEKLPSSGGTLSNGSAERPRTATTTITTISSSPKFALKSGRSTNGGAIGGQAAADMHPLLHQSLTRAKATLSPSLYRVLETAASDALEMSVLSGNTGQQGPAYSAASMVNGGVTDRQLRRKADNVCRSLTELCIALTEGRHEASGLPQAVVGARRESRDYSSAAPSPTTVETPNSTKMYSRRQSLEPEGTPDMARPSPSRALDRVEARRTSLMAMQKSANNSPREPPKSSQFLAEPNTATTPSPQISARPARTGTSLLRTRIRRAAEDEEDDQVQRPPSRAATDVGGTSFRKRANRLSGGLLSVKPSERTYTSQHPLPTQPRDSTLPQPTPLRRVTASALKPDGSSSSLPSRKLFERDTDASSSLGAPADDERRVKRRSLGLYTSARASLGLKRPTSMGKTTA